MNIKKQTIPIDEQFNNEELQFIDTDKAYLCSPSIKCKNFTLLMKFVLLANKIDIELVKTELKQCDINQKNDLGWTALMIACANSSILKQSDSSDNKIIRLLLENNADVNLQNSDGLSALILASKYSSSASNPETVKLLLEYKANVNLQITSPKNNIPKIKSVETALMAASVHSASSETVKLLLDHGANVNLRNSNGCTALMLACNFNNTIDIVKLLIEYKTDIHLVDNLNQNALMISGTNKKTSIYQYLAGNSLHTYAGTVQQINELTDEHYNYITFQIKNSKNNLKIIEYLLACYKNKNTENKEEEIIKVEPKKEISDNDIAEQNYQILCNLKYPEKLLVNNNTFKVDTRWFNGVQRYFSNDNRTKLIDPLKFTFDILMNDKDKTEFVLFLKSTKEYMRQLYPKFTELHELFDQYIIKLN